MRTISIFLSLLLFSVLGAAQTTKVVSAASASPSVVLAWQEADTSATSFNVYRGPASGQEALYANVAAPSYTDSAVLSGQTYFYAVTAVGAGGESGPSNEVSATLMSSQAWAKVAPSGSWPSSWPSGRGWNRLIYDPVQLKVLEYAAVSPCGDPFSNAIWAYDPVANVETREWWSGGGANVNGVCVSPVTYVSPPNGPGDRHPTQQMAIDPGRKQLMITGGVEDRYAADGVTPGQVHYGDAWLFDLAQMTFTRVADQPSGLAQHMEGGMAFDPNCDCYILFGGTTNGGTTTYTWAYYPATNSWAKIATAGPSGRLRNTVFYDAAFGHVICYGGLIGSTWLSDMWWFDSTAKVWHQFTQQGAIPPVTKFPPMAFDSKNGLDYLFASGKTYVFNALTSTWALDAATGGPGDCGSYCNARTLAYDEAADVMVMQDITQNDANQNLYVLANPQ